MPRGNLSSHLTPLFHKCHGFSYLGKKGFYFYIVLSLFLFLCSLFLSGAIFPHNCSYSQDTGRRFAGPNNESWKVSTIPPRPPRNVSNHQPFIHGYCILGEEPSHLYRATAGNVRGSQTATTFPNIDSNSGALFHFLHI